MEIPADGTGTPRSLAEGVATDAFAVSPDGRALAFAIEKEGHRSLWRLDLAADAVPVRLTPNDSVQEAQPAISPDGRWLAYVSDEAGPMQVFVRSFPDGAHKQQVSLNEGLYPFWARTGTAVLYWERDALMEVPVQAGASLAVGAARRLFTAADVGMLPSEASLVPALDLAADGRFLFVRRSSDDPRGGILVVENWIEEFRKR
jgi:serine/threonine-protein kinase